MDFTKELNKIEFEDDEADRVMLYDFIEELEKLSNQREAVPVIFSFIEKHSDKDLGSPGPLVHFLEANDDYRDELILSLSRKPTDLTVWLVNRILNVSHANEYDLWFQRLQSVLKHPKADNMAKEAALEFIEYQNE